MARRMLREMQLRVTQRWQAGGEADETNHDVCASNIRTSEGTGIVSLRMQSWLDVYRMTGEAKSTGITCAALQTPLEWGGSK